MTAESHPFATTRAAMMLSDAISRYTSARSGGLRGLAATLGFKQATVLSQLAKGRIAIPLDRAPALAAELELDEAVFCLAVVEQRAPDLYSVLNDALDLDRLSTLSPAGRQIVKALTASKTITDEQVRVVTDVLHSSQPGERWLPAMETGFYRVIRDHFPDGVPYNEIEPLAEAIEAHLAE